MIKGKYIIKSDGKIIAEKENIITTNGFYMINRHLVKSSMDWAGSLAIGTVSTAPSISDKELYFEIDRMPVTLKSYQKMSPRYVILTRQLGLAPSISAVTPSSPSAGSVTYTTSTNHNFAIGQTVTITGVSPSGYNTTAVITGIPSATQFTITNATTGAATLTSALATVNSACLTFKSITSPILLNNYRIQITGVDTVFNGTYNITSYSALQAPITNISASAGTITFTANNQFTVGETVVITGVNPTVFNITGTVATASNTQFTITNSATGTYVSGGTATQQNSYQIFFSKTSALGTVPLTYMTSNTSYLSVLSDSSGNAIYNNEIVVKATLDPALAARIYEVGVLPINLKQANLSALKNMSGFSEKSISDSSLSQWISSSATPSISLSGQTTISGSATTQQAGYTWFPGSSNVTLNVGNTAGLKVGSNIHITGVTSSLSNVLASTASGNGSTVTYTTSAAHNFLTGQTVSVTGFTPSGYNVTSKQIVVTSSTTFTVSDTTTGTSSGTGTITPLTSVPSGSATIASINGNYQLTATMTSGTNTSGATQYGYGGTISLNSTTQSQPSTFGQFNIKLDAADTATLSNVVIDTGSYSSSDSLLLLYYSPVATNSLAFTVNLTDNNLSSSFNCVATGLVASVGLNVARIALPSTFPSGGITVNQIRITNGIALSNIQPSTPSAGTITFTTSSAHGFAAGQTISITGANPSGYNLTGVTIASVPSPTTFTVTNGTTGSYVSGGVVSVSSPSFVFLDCLKIITNDYWTAHPYAGTLAISNVTPGFIGATPASGYVTYTTVGSHNYSIGNYVTISGINPSGYNIASTDLKQIYSIPSRNQFVVASSATGSYVSGGISVSTTTVTIPPEYQLSSRSIFTNPLIKNTGQQMDIEYHLQVT